jgi:hypothetical protein
MEEGGRDIMCECGRGEAQEREGWKRSVECVRGMERETNRAGGEREGKGQDIMGRGGCM